MLLIAASMGALWGVDAFLARMEHSEMLGEAQHDFDTGSALFAQSYAADAIGPLRKAHTLDRSNRQYTLRLVAALVEIGKLDDAGALLTDLLERFPNDGETNLAEARLLVREGAWENAFAYYHRAIYGSWDSGDPSRLTNPSIGARLELANLLVQRGLQKELLAEVLPLETEAANDPDVLRKVAKLYMVAGSPVRAEATYRKLLDEQSDDPELYMGLGDAELALGNYHAAEAAFQNAIRNGADRSRLEQEIQLAADVSALDPTLRRLTSVEKFKRAVRILELSLDTLKVCAQADSAAPISVAETLLATQIRGNPTNELAEERLSMAEQLWQARIKGCGASTSIEEEPLRLVIGKISQ
jgi:tetratricopeptide (TPR) repeat protein